MPNILQFVELLPLVHQVVSDVADVDRNDEATGEVKHGQALVRLAAMLANHPTVAPHVGREQADDFLARLVGAFNAIAKAR